MRDAARRPQGGRRREVRLSCRRPLPILVEGSERVLRRERRRDPERPRGRGRERVRAPRLHEHRGHDRARRSRPGPRRRRDGLAADRAPLRVLQAVEVRGRARGAAGGGCGASGRPRPADASCRAARSRPHSDRADRPRLPQRADARLLRHVAQRRRRRTTSQPAMCLRSSTAGRDAATSSAARTGRSSEILDILAEETGLPAPRVPGPCRRSPSVPPSCPSSSRDAWPAARPRCRSRRPGWPRRR